EAGRDADFAVLAPDETFTVDPAALRAAGRPDGGWGAGVRTGRPGPHGRRASRAAARRASGAEAVRRAAGW
ncbi:hypothetical protein ACWDNY_31060, partial [Streptomyces sp. NPDC003697]